MQSTQRIQLWVPSPFGASRLGWQAFGQLRVSVLGSRVTKYYEVDGGITCMQALMDQYQHYVLR